MENPTREEVGRAFDTLAAAPTPGPPADRKSDAQDFFSSAVALTGAGSTEVEASGCATAGADACASLALLGFTSEIFASSMGAIMARGETGDLLTTLPPATETEVFVDTGDPGMGVSGAVELVSVAEEEGTSGDVSVDSSVGSDSGAVRGGLTPSPEAIASITAGNTRGEGCAEEMGDTGGVGS